MYNNLYNYNNIPNDNKSNTYQIDSMKGFLRGNLFDNLYDPYMNMQPAELKPKTEKEALLQKVQQYNFAMIDLNLYLDNYPKDQEVLKIFIMYLGMLKSAIANYEQKYGPLTISNEPINVGEFIYVMSPWPWEVQS